MTDGSAPMHRQLDSEHPGTGLAASLAVLVSEAIVPPLRTSARVPETTSPAAVVPAMVEEPPAVPPAAELPAEEDAPEPPSEAPAPAADPAPAPTAVPLSLEGFDPNKYLAAPNEVRTAAPGELTLATRTPVEEEPQPISAAPYIPADPNAPRGNRAVLDMLRELSVLRED